MPKATLIARAICLLILALTISSADAPNDTVLGARFPALSPDGATVAFEYWGDIWTVPADGSAPARRLTDHLAWDSGPRFSPDGKTIAFNSTRSGNDEIWLVPAEGGVARQLTDFGGDSLCDWTPDGKEVVFESGRGLWSSDLYRVAVDGAKPAQQITRLDHFNSVDGLRLPDGGWLYARGSGAWWRKGYHGTSQYDLWRIYPDGHHEQLTTTDCNELWPMLSADGKTAYYVCSSSGIDNIYALDLKTRQSKQLTHHQTDGVQFPSIAPGGDTIVYESDGKLYSIKTGGGSPRQLKISVAAEGKANWTSRNNFANAAESYAVSPNGKYAAFIVAGDLWAIKDPKGYKEEDKPDQDLARALRLTQSDGARERMPAFARDNRRIAYVSDADGDYEVYVVDLADMSVKQVTDNDVDDLSPQFDPSDGDVIFYYSGNRQLMRKDLRTNEAAKVAEGRFRGAFGHLGFAVSPDGKWVSYTDELDDWSNEVYLVDSLGKAKPVNISRHPEWDGASAWSGDGKRLIFRSGRDNGGIYAIELNPEAKKYDFEFLYPDDKPKPAEKKEEAPKDQPKPAVPDKQQQANGKPGEKQNSAKPPEPKKEEPKPNPPAVVIDFKDLYLRARRVTTQGSVDNSVVSPDSKWVVYQCNPGSGTAIWAVKTDGSGAHQVQGGGWTDPVFADQGRRIYYRDGGTLRYMKFNDGNSQGVETIDARGDYEVDKRVRWHQMYSEGWRTLREQFYDPAMHGADWDAVYRKYQPLIDAAGTPEEFGLIFTELLGELNASHLGISMAESSFNTAHKATCHLGLEFDPAYSGTGLKVSHVTWRGPADQPGVDIKPGDVLRSIEGQEVGGGVDWIKLLDDRQDRPTRLRFDPRPDAKEGKQREVVIKPWTYGAYQDALYREWEKANEDTVSRLSGGRIGYIHIRSMSHGELAKFEREFYSDCLDKDALIVDVRFNPGGFIHEELFNDLSRNPFGFANHRDSEPALQPARAFAKPKALMINARCGSDSEIFPAGWRALKLGPIVGIATAGAVIGTSGFDLMDGTYVRLPLEGWWDIDMRKLENSGTPPDIVVDVTPDELAAGKDAQLEKTVAVLLEELKS